MTSSISFSHSNGQRKRKRDEDGDEDNIDADAVHDASGYIDDDEEPFKFGTAVLPVANLPYSFEGIPQNGMEYLFTVRREERSLPLVTRVRNPCTAADQDVHSVPVNTGNQKNVEDNAIIPSEKWRACFEERFKNLRQNMRQSTIHIALPDTTPFSFPAMRDRDRWWAFFRGDVDWERIPCSQFHNPQGKKKEKSLSQPVSNQARVAEPVVVYEEALSWDDTGEGDVQLTYEAEGNEEEEEGLLQDLEGVVDGYVSQNNGQSLSASTNPQSENGVIEFREPTPRLLAVLDQKFVVHLLKYFTQWIQGHFDDSFLPAPPEPPDSNMKRSYDFTPRHGRWIFALLTQLDSHLTSDEISFLRKLVREIFRLIKEERLDRENQFSTRSQTSHMGEVGCWMVVAAVTGVWGQRDLWNDALDALRESHFRNTE